MSSAIRLLHDVLNITLKACKARCTINGEYLLIIVNQLNVCYYYSLIITGALARHRGTIDITMVPRVRHQGSYKTRI